MCYRRVPDTEAYFSALFVVLRDQIWWQGKRHLPCEHVNKLLQAQKLFTTYPKAQLLLPPMLAHLFSYSECSTWGGHRSAVTLQEAPKLLRRQFEIVTSAS
jgi:hypothetical protein